MMDPRTILFSIPTLANDAPPLSDARREITDADLILHEDEWRQLEFFAVGRLEEVQRTLTELKAFESANRVQSGWRQAYVRNVPPAPLLRGSDAAATLSGALGRQLGPPPFFFYGGNVVTGSLANGFTVSLGPGATLYGVSSDEGVTVLSAHLRNADDMLLTSAFTALHRTFGFILVDWQAQMLLTSVDQQGQIGVWAPQ